MTALQIIDRNADASGDWYARVVPHDDIVVGLFYPRATDAKSKRNLTNVPSGARNGSVEGTPTYSSGYASFTSYQNYVKTNVPETDDLTVVYIAKSSSACDDNSNRPNFVGNYGGGSGGILCYATTSGASKYMRGQVANGANSNVSKLIDVTSTLSSWAMYAFTVGGGNITMRDHTHGTQQTGAITGRTKLTSLINIGSSRSASFSGGPCDIAAVLIANAAATTDQLDDWQTMFNADLSAFSISI